MPKFIIEYDTSRKNNNNEFLPLKEFIPGVISLKSTNKPYTLYVGELNKSAFFNTIDVFKSNIEIYKKILSMLPPRTEILNKMNIVYNSPSKIPSKVHINIQRPPIKFNPITGLIKPYVFANVNPKFIPPSTTTNFINQVRKNAMENIRLPVKEIFSPIERKTIKIK